MVGTIAILLQIMPLLICRAIARDKSRLEESDLEEEEQMERERFLLDAMQGELAHEKRVGDGVRGGGGGVSFVGQSPANTPRALSPDTSWELPLSLENRDNLLGFSGGGGGGGGIVTTNLTSVGGGGMSPLYESQQSVAHTPPHSPRYSRAFDHNNTYGGGGGGGGSSSGMMIPRGPGGGSPMNSPREMMMRSLEASLQGTSQAGRGGRGGNGFRSVELYDEGATTTATLMSLSPGLWSMRVYRGGWALSVCLGSCCQDSLKLFGIGGGGGGSGEVVCVY